MHDLVANQPLAHLVGCNVFVCALSRSARTRPNCFFNECWSEGAEVARPGGYGVSRVHPTSLPFPSHLALDLSATMRVIVSSRALYVASASFVNSRLCPH